MNVYFIISLIICLISLYFINYGSKMNNNQLVYGGFIAIIASIVAAIYFGCASSTEKRTIYPGWDESTDSALVPGTGPLWTSSASGSNKKPNYLGDGPAYDVGQTQRQLTSTWIESKVNSGGTSDSWTSMKSNAITSILVRDANGDDRELPIMDFFKKIHEDIQLGFARATDYASAATLAAAQTAEENDRVLKTEYTRLITDETAARKKDDTDNMSTVNGELAKKVPKNENLYIKFGGTGGYLYTDWMSGVKANGGGPGESIQIYT